MQTNTSLHTSSYTRPLSATVAKIPTKTQQNKTLRSNFTCKAAGRPMWLNGASPPTYLDGSLPGDYGFDPLGLGANPERLEWYAEAEKMNGRWAMMAVLGVLFTEAFGVEDKFWLAGSRSYPVPFNVLVVIEVVTLGFLEMKRLQGFKEKKTTGFLFWFPFDPSNMTSDGMQVKEVKNGRLAMLAYAGFLMQALVVRKGPIACLNAHLADPFGNNILTNILNISDNISSSS